MLDSISIQQKGKHLRNSEYFVISNANQRTLKLCFPTERRLKTSERFLQLFVFRGVANAYKALATLSECATRSGYDVGFLEDIFCYLDRGHTEARNVCKDVKRALRAMSAEAIYRVETVNDQSAVAVIVLHHSLDIGIRLVECSDRRRLHRLGHACNHKLLHLYKLACNTLTCTDVAYAEACHSVGFGEAVYGYYVVRDLAVNCGEDVGTVERFIAENGYTFDVHADESYRWGGFLTGIPYTVVIGPDGTVAATQLGGGAGMYSHYAEIIDGLI